MLRNSKELREYKLVASDGEIGHSLEFYFDDRKWIIQYFIVDTGSWLKNHKAIVSPSLILEPDRAKREFPLKITREWINTSPKVEEETPVSLQKKREMGAYDGTPAYLQANELFEIGREKQGVENTEKNKPRKKIADSPHLRSTGGITGYAIKAADGTIGQIEDFIIDDDKWVIRFLVVDTGGKKVLLGPEWIIQFDSKKRTAQINLPRQRVTDAPEYDPEQAVNMEMENRMYEYYGSPA